MNINVLDLARQEFDDAFVHCESPGRGLGEQFRAAIKVGDEDQSPSRCVDARSPRHQKKLRPSFFLRRDLSKNRRRSVDSCFGPEETHSALLGGSYPKVSCRKWDLAMRLTYFYGTLSEDGRILGQTEYDARMGGANIGKFGPTAEKIRPLIAELFRNATPAPTEKIIGSRCCWRANESRIFRQPRLTSPPTPPASP
ncbi:MAG: hypothetical protein H7343_18035 [Undibacterium sp.]|nr:hypothetical protein [Opitutaceae bacterium]